MKTRIFEWHPSKCLKHFWNFTPLACTYKKKRWREFSLHWYSICVSADHLILRESKVHRKYTSFCFRTGFTRRAVIGRYQKWRNNCFILAKWCFPWSIIENCRNRNYVIEISPMIMASKMKGFSLFLSLVVKCVWKGPETQLLYKKVCYSSSDLCQIQLLTRRDYLFWNRGL